MKSTRIPTIFPRNTEQFNTEMSLSLEGIGAVLQMDDDYTVINSMVAGGPAAKRKLSALVTKLSVLVKQASRWLT
ncbi:hypothetical protein ACVXHA_01630 [Escherichia coli]